MKDTLSRANAVDRALVALRNCSVSSREGHIGEYLDAFQFTACASGNFQVPSKISARGR